MSTADVNTNQNIIQVRWLNRLSRMLWSLLIQSNQENGNDYPKNQVEAGSSIKQETLVNTRAMTEGRESNSRWETNSDEAFQAS